MVKTAPGCRVTLQPSGKRMVALPPGLTMTELANVTVNAPIDPRIAAPLADQDVSANGLNGLGHAGRAGEKTRSQNSRADPGPHCHNPSRIRNHSFSTKREGDEQASASVFREIGAKVIFTQQSRWLYLEQLEIACAGSSFLWNRSFLILNRASLIIGVSVSYD